MKKHFLNPLRLFVLTVLLLGSIQLSAQISMKPPVPVGPSWAACAGVDNGSGPFNEYYATISWAGAPNADNEFILEISDANGDFTNAVEVARVSGQNATFDIQFAIPTDTRGDDYKLRAKSTSPVDEEESVANYNMYYRTVTTNLNISELGDGVPPGTICSTGPTTLQVDNIPNPETHQYLWFRSGTQLAEKSHILTVTESGMYRAYVDYGPICSDSTSESNLVEATIGTTGVGIGITTPSKTALCAGDTETLTADIIDTATYNYQWYKDDAKIPGATLTSYVVDANFAGFEGDYQVEISGAATCTQRSDAVSITNADNFTVTRNNPANVVVLPTQSETLSVTTNAITPTYQWYRNGSMVAGATNSTLDITQDGSYYAEITQAGGTCPGTKKNSETTVAVVPASFEIVVDHNAAYTACANTDTVLEVATINAVAGDGTKTDVTAQLETSFTYQWQKDGVDVAGATGQNISLTDTSENGSYTVNATLASYNETSAASPVQLLTSETVTISGTGTVYCNSSDTITISTTTDLSAETFRWELDGASINTTDASFTVTGPGTYRLVLDKNGCDLPSNEIVISTLDPDLITFDIDGDVIFPEGSSKTINASGGDEYTWYDSDNNNLGTGSSFTFTQDGTYQLVATIGNCDVSKTVNVVYLDLFNVPNVITPNGDGANDQWVIPNSYSNKKEISIVIYDDKGVELLNQTGYQNNWPESSMTFPAQNMVFYYVIKNASEVLKQGTITVIR